MAHSDNGMVIAYIIVNLYYQHHSARRSLNVTEEIVMFELGAARRVRLNSCLFLLFLLLATSMAQAEEGRVGKDLSATQVQREYFDTANALGYRPVRLTGYLKGTATRFMTRWVRNTDNRRWWGYFHETQAELFTRVAWMRSHGFRPIDVSGYPVGSEIRFASLWEENTSNIRWNLYYNRSISDMETLIGNYTGTRWYPTSIEGYWVNGNPSYISTWEYKTSPPAWRLHLRMTRNEYQTNLAQFVQEGYRPIQVDQHLTADNNDYYTAIWHYGSSGEVRTNRQLEAFQRWYNNLWAAGKYLHNFVVAEGSDQKPRYGGIWRPDSPRPTTTWRDRIRLRIDSAPARAGFSFMRLSPQGTVLDEYHLHENDTYNVASTSKIAVLYALLREVDAGRITLATEINSGAQFGTNQPEDDERPGLITANTDYSVRRLIEFMIGSSNNWASNRLIRRIGKVRINAHLNGRGLRQTRINRYMLGTGAPSMHGLSSALADHNAGYDNNSSPLEMNRLMRGVLFEDWLSADSRAEFINFLAFDPDANQGVGDLVNSKRYIGSRIESRGLETCMQAYSKGGSLNIGVTPVPIADSGFITLPGGEQLLLSIYFDEISDNPDNPQTVSQVTADAVRGTFNPIIDEVIDRFTSQCN